MTREVAVAAAEHLCKSVSVDYELDADGTVLALSVPPYLNSVYRLPVPPFWVVPLRPTARRPGYSCFVVVGDADPPRLVRAGE